MSHATDSAAHTVASEYPLLTALFLAVALPFSIAYQRAPQPAFYSQATALAAWAIVGALAVWIGLQERNNARAPASPSSRVVLAIWGALLVVAISHAICGLSPGFIVAPSAVALLLALTASASVLLVGDDPVRRQRLLGALMLGLVAAALVNALAAGVQAFAPGFADDVWFASRGTPAERIGGNLRQPNQLATLMVWGMLAATWLTWRHKPIWALLCTPMLVALFASGSRTGVLSLALIIGAALLRSQFVRRLRLRGWVALLIALAIIAWFAEAVFSRATANAALTQRLALWHDVFVLIGNSPWFGVGLGQLNFAWTLTPLPTRAPDVFDHAHSLPLQLAVEMGVPIAVALIAAIAFAFGSARAALRSRSGATVALLLATILLHSLLEYPLWFGYFLLPTAFLFTWYTSATHKDEADQRPISATGAGGTTFTMLCTCAAIASLVAFTAVLYAVDEYGKAAAIHDRSPTGVVLRHNVEVARASPLYGHFGDYAAIMLADGDAPQQWFTRPLRHVLDERLLAAYALALARDGDSERARYITARAWEFPPHILFERLRRIAPPPTSSAPAAPASIRGPADFPR